MESQNTSTVPVSSPIVSVSEYLALPRSPQTWLVEPLLPLGGQLLLYGDPKVGKSFAALQLAASIAKGEDWLGFRVPTRSRVLYIQLDTPRSLWAARIEGLHTFLQLLQAPHTTSSTTLPIADLWLADRETLDCWPFDILEPEHEGLLAQVVGPLNPQVVILDTLREAHSGDENDSTAMQNVIAHLTAAVKPAALILVAHSRKANPEFGPSLMNDNRGSNYIVGKMDGIVHFTQDGIQAGGRAMEETEIKLDRLSNGLWQLSDRERIKVLARKLLEDPEGSLRSKAKRLSEQTGKSEEAALSLLVRTKEGVSFRNENETEHKNPQ